jgi:lipoate-protein ligase A
VEAYRILGVDATLTARARGVQGAGACYLHATSADLSLGAAKLSGSAQVWNRNSVLQHGSFVLTRDVEREAAAFRLGPEKAAALAASTDTIVGALGRRPASAALESAAIQGFEGALGIVLEPGDMSLAELARIETLEPSFAVGG